MESTGLYGGPYPFIQTGDISNADHWLTEYTQTYSELGLAQSRLWPKGTICIAIVGATVGETAILDFEACFPDSVIGIVVDDQLADNEYVEFLFQSFKAIMKEKGKGTARDNINLRTFENQTFPFPALKRQKEIVATLNALREETQRLESIYRHKLATLDELKKSMLHQAFSGQL
ncbi:MAG TPA: restriction endonuclease subunit S [Candidatus Competibacter phosphatis]|nr:restriction endonuclease subunit S [Candidatus Competibacter phosphatis]